MLSCCMVMGHQPLIDDEWMSTTVYTRWRDKVCAAVLSKTLKIFYKVIMEIKCGKIAEP